MPTYLHIKDLEHEEGHEHWMGFIRPMTAKISTYANDGVQLFTYRSRRITSELEHRSSQSVHNLKGSALERVSC